MEFTTPPASQSSTPPPVLFWFKLYCAAMTCLYGLCVLAGPLLIWLAAAEVKVADDRAALTIQGIVLACIGLPFAIACALPFFLSRKRWVWIYDLVIICVGMTSCCCLPACIPLLIFWIKPELKAWFGR